MSNGFLLLFLLCKVCSTSFANASEIDQSCTTNLQLLIKFRAVNCQDDDDAADVSKDLQKLFQKIDELGRSSIQNAKFVELEFSDSQASERKWTLRAWLVNQDDDSVTVLRDDLVAWRYKKETSTIVPSSWQPSSVQLTSTKELDFENHCKKLAVSTDEAGQESENIGTRLRGPGPSKRFLVAHAAWKKGLTQYCERIVSHDPNYKSDFEEYQKSVLEDLAWQHFLRGVNLLMFADRKTVFASFASG